MAQAQSNARLWITENGDSITRGVSAFLVAPTDGACRIAALGPDADIGVLFSVPAGADSALLSTALALDDAFGLTDIQAFRSNARRALSTAR